MAVRIVRYLVALLTALAIAGCTGGRPAQDLEATDSRPAREPAITAEGPSGEEGPAETRETRKGDGDTFMTEEQAVAAARPHAPQMPSRARLVPDYTLGGKSGDQTRPVWLVEAIDPMGNRLRVIVDAVTGESLAIAQIEPPHFPDSPRSISRDEAIAVALQHVTPEDGAEPSVAPGEATEAPCRNRQLCR